MEFFYDHMCFACGNQNPYGLHLKFEADGEKVKTTFIPKPEHQGYPGIMHGGLITTVMDEVMARCVNILGLHGVTARMELRFREGIPIGEAIKVEASITNARKTVVDLKAYAYLPNGKVAAEAMARFMVIGKIEEGKQIHEE